MPLYKFPVASCSFHCDSNAFELNNSINHGKNQVQSDEINTYNELSWLLIYLACLSLCLSEACLCSQAAINYSSHHYTIINSWITGIYTNCKAAACEHTKSPNKWQ